MKTRLHCRAARTEAFLMADLLVGIFLLSVAVVPLAFSFVQDAKLLRQDYARAVVMEIVDGEAEILAAGEWKIFPEGTHPYLVHCAAARQLPPGDFRLTRTGGRMRLEWKPTERAGLGSMVREYTIQ